jgi:hemolysin III
MSDRDVSAAAPSPAPEGPTVGEEIVHAATHGLGAVLSLAVLVSLVGFALAHGTTSNVVSAAVFGSSLMAVYVSSTAYHAVPPRHTRLKEALRICDHAAIHLLIAGTATPIILCAFEGRSGWIALGVMWTLALFGVVVETTALRKRTRLSIGVYLGNGWVGALAIPSLYSAMSVGSLSCLVLGGVAYTAGVPFFLAHRTKWMHAWWHAFVLAGSALHVAAVVLAMS